MDYDKMPAELKRICALFAKAELQYNLFKCEHVLQGANKNLDLLFLQEADYQKASAVLEREGYLLYLDESIEKYKKMYVKVHQKDNFKQELNAVHLHREIAWHGLIALDKNKIFARSKNNLPSPEDALLIHAAHALFENFLVTPFQKELLHIYQKKAADQHYLSQHLAAVGWKKAFEKFVAHDFSVSKGIILDAYLGRFSKKPLLILKPISKIATKFLRNFSLRRRGILIALSGVNGSGKTTLVNALLQNYQPITRFFHGQHGYYYGWDPFLPLTKLLSRSTRHSNIYQQLNTVTEKKFSLKKECILAYNYVEYLTRYFVHIYPALRRGKLVVTDRYFYDLYAQHAYAENSRIIPALLRLFPKPDYFFILNAEISTISKRDKNNTVLSSTVIRDAERKIHPRQELEDQIRRYRGLQEKYQGMFIETEKTVAENTAQIIQKSWPALTA